MTFYDTDPKRPDPPGVLGGLPAHVRAAVEDEPRSSRPTCATPRTSSPFSPPSTVATTSPTRRTSTPPATPGSSRPPPAPARSPRRSWPRTPTTPRASWSRPPRPAWRPSTRCTRCPTRAQQVFTVSDGFVPASQSTLSASNQNFNLTAWMVGSSDPGQYGPAQVTSTRRPRARLGPANADAEISANSTVSQGHLAAGPARVRGAARGDADGPDRRVDGLPAPAVRRRRRRTRSRS